MTIILRFISSLRFILLMIWAGWTALYAFLLHYLGLDWNYSVTDSLVTNTLLALICISLGNTMLYYQPSRESSWKLIFWCLLASLIWALTCHWTLGYFFRSPGHSLFLQRSFPFRFTGGVLFTGCTILLVWVREFMTFTRESETRQSAIDQMAREAELEGLTRQLQPHFLFNSLNSINALIGSAPEQAREMVQKLSDYFRGNLLTRNKKFHPLSDELKQLDLYFEIEKVRFGHRLNTHMEAEEACQNILIPTLLLQPLAENAIKFGLYGTAGTVMIELNAQKTGGGLLIRLRNPYDPQFSPTGKGTGFGLQSVKRRLYLLYGRHDLLKISSENNTFETLILIPS